MPKVMTVGSFTILHEDHHVLLSACRDMAGTGEVIVGVNSSGFVMAHKGFYPEPADVRAQPIMNRGDIDAWFENDDESLQWHIDRHRPTILAIGSDWAGKDYLGQIGMTWKQLWHLGCNIAYVPSLERVHSSDLRKES